jgi:hypothetical protein
MSEDVIEHFFEVGYYLKDVAYVMELTVEQMYWHRAQLVRLLKEQNAK